MHGVEMEEGKRKTYIPCGNSYRSQGGSIDQ